MTPPAERMRTKFLKDQPDACLDFFVGIQDHFPSQPAS
jgi:hypothetical protein